VKIELPAYDSTAPWSALRLVVSSHDGRIDRLRVIPSWFEKALPLPKHRRLRRQPANGRLRFEVARRSAIHVGHGQVEAELADLRPTMVSVAPRLANSVAAALPIPSIAPVTRMILPARWNSRQCPGDAFRKTLEYRFAKMASTTPSWDDLRILLAVHRDKSFLAAGKTLGVAASTIARRVETLERALGRSIVHRGNDGTRLDPDALRLVALAEQLELGLSVLARDGSDAEVSGIVRVSLSEGFVRPLVPSLARLQAKYAALAIELISESRIADIGRGEADIGVRIVRSTSPLVVSKLVGHAKTGLFAARDYVARRLPNALLSRAIAGTHDWVGMDRSLERLPHERWLRDYGASRFVFRSNSAVAIEHALLSGMGIGLLSQTLGASLPGLVQLDIEQPPPQIDVFLAFHRDAKKTPRVRVVVKAIEAEVRRQLV